MTRLRTLTATTFCGIALLATACGNGPTASSGAAAGGGAVGTAGATLGTAVPATTVSLTDANVFTPSTLTAKVGDIITFKNSGSAAHNTTFTGNDSLDSATMSGGDTWQVKFTVAGTYDYVCTFHAGIGMKGSITVS